MSEILMPRSRRVRLYDADGNPVRGFNAIISGWLQETTRVVEHLRPAAFQGLRVAYDQTIAVSLAAGRSPAEAHKTSLSQLTKLLFGHDLAAELSERLEIDLVNKGGFRTTLSQGVAKNVGENFVNVLVYAIAEVLKNRDDVLIDKGLPPELKKVLQLKRQVPLKTGDRQISIPIEGDLAIYSRSNPLNAIVVSAKTRLKEVFHIGTMWKLLFDTINDPYCLAKWKLSPATNKSVANVLYVFATADMVNDGGTNSQGPDVERAVPRNLIAMDASFFDYVFVSKTGISHVENSIELGKRGALFHELGCILDLIEQKFPVRLDQA